MIQPKQQTFSGTALVVEDDMIIALDVEDMLLSLGASKVLVASSVSEALHFIDVQMIDFAVLDVSLGSETSERVGLTLSERGTPFVFATGHSGRMSLAEKFPGVKVVRKPYDEASLLAVIDEV